MNTLVCSANSFTVYCMLFFFSLFPQSVLMNRTSCPYRLTSALKKKVDNKHFSHLTLLKETPFVNSMGLSSGLIHVQLFLAVQNSSFCCLILKIGVSYHIILMDILIMNTLVYSANSFYCLLHVVILLIIFL